MEFTSEQLDPSDKKTSPAANVPSAPKTSGTAPDMNVSLAPLFSELETLRENVQKRKREITSLKVLLYTGFALLLGGFIYSNTTLQRVQLETLEENIRLYQSQIQRDLLIVQDNLLSQVRAIVKDEIALQEIRSREAHAAQREALLNVTLDGIAHSVDILSQNHPELQPRANTIRSEIDNLRNAVTEQQAGESSSLDLPKLQPEPKP